MVRVGGIGDDVELLVEAENAVAVLGRGVAFAADVAGIEMSGSPVPVVIHRQAVAVSAGRELPEEVGEPAHAAWMMSWSTFSGTEAGAST